MASYVTFNLNARKGKLQDLREQAQLLYQAVEQAKGIVHVEMQVYEEEEKIALLQEWEEASQPDTLLQQHHIKDILQDMKRYLANDMDVRAY